MKNLIMFICFLTVSILSLRTEAKSQIVYSAEIKRLLSTRVSLNLGLTTVQKLVEELSRQTGVVVKASEYLNEHQLFLNVTGMSADKILTSVSEMHHWRWLENSKSEIVLTHRTILMPVNVADYPKAFRTVFPVAWLPLLGDGMDWSLLLTEEDRAFEKERLMTELTQKITNPFPFMDAKHAVVRMGRTRLRQRLNLSVAGNDISVFLFPKVNDYLKNGAAVSFARCSDHDRDSSVKYILLELLSKQFDSGQTDFLLEDKLPLYLTKPETATIFIQGNEFLMGHIDRSINGEIRGQCVGHTLDYLQSKND